MQKKQQKIIMLASVVCVLSLGIFFSRQNAGNDPSNTNEQAYIQARHANDLRGKGAPLDQMLKNDVPSQEPIDKSLSSSFAVTNKASGSKRSSVNESVSSAFTLYKLGNYSQYQDIYQVNDIKSYSNNGGQYSTSSLNRAFDGDLSTHWETGKPNSATHANEVIVTFNAVERINRIAYCARRDNYGKGFAQEYSIYASMEETGDDFMFVAGGTAIKYEINEFKFPATEFKRLKFVFNQALDSWASASEFWFFREDAVLDQLDTMFTDGTMSALSAGYQNPAALNGFVDAASTHPFFTNLQPVIDVAKDIAANSNLRQQDIMTLSQKGNETSERSRTGIAIALYGLDSTGRYLCPGQTLQIFVDADPTGIMPQIMLGQFGSQEGWLKTYPLNPGYNEIQLDPGITTPHTVHLINRALPNEQSYPPRVRLYGGNAYPLYVDGVSDPVRFISELENYLANARFEDTAFLNGNPNGYHFNVAELTSENITITTSAAGLLKALKTDYANGKTADGLMKIWENMYQTYGDYSAFNSTDPTAANYRPRGEFVLRVFTDGPIGWAGHGYTGYNGGNPPKKESGFYSELFMHDAIKNGNWIIFHEIGHQYENGATRRIEVTNNLYSIMMQDLYGNKNRFQVENKWSKFEKYHNSNDKIFEAEDVFFLTATIYQLELLYGPNTLYGAASQIVRTNQDGIMNGLINEERLAVALSLAANTNLMPHFEYYKYPISQAARDRVSHLPTDGKKTYYINDKLQKQTASAFKNPDIKPTLTATGNKAITLTMSIAESEDAFLCYEIYRDQTLLGVTYSNQFIDNTVKDDTSYAYQVLAYDCRLGTSQMSDTVTKNTREPLIVSAPKATVALNETFDPFQYVKAISYNSKEISKQITIQSSTVDTSKRGSYEVTYSVTDQGITSQKTMPVQVASQVIYASDLNWKSAAVGWGSPQKDQSPRNAPLTLQQYGVPMVFPRGLGTHANSQVIYDLTDRDFEFFTSYIGIDQGSTNPPEASAFFEVWTDGKKVFSSKEFGYDTNFERIQIPVKGVKELKLITDGGNRNWADDTVWADAKFTNSNVKPTLTIPANSTEGMNTDFDAAGVYTAYDAEDGDITGNVVVESKVNVKVPGNYQMTYTVSDSDGNTATATRTVSIASILTYASDLEWQSAAVGWGDPQKDLSPRKTPITLLQNGKKTVFAKGLGAHANSQIVYDITNKGYEFFTAYVGIDQVATSTTEPSATFEVWVDGKQVYKSKLFGYNTPCELLQVPIEGANEIKLIADGGNRNWNDDTVWAGARFGRLSPLAPSAPKADFSVLNATLAKAESVQEDWHTPLSYGVLSDAIQKAQVVIANNNATQAQVDEASSRLMNAMTNLELAMAEPVEKRSLRLLFEQAQTIVYTDQDPVLWANFLQARDAARDNLPKDLPSAIWNEMYVNLRDSMNAIK